MKKQYFVWGQNNFGQLGLGSNLKKQIFIPEENFLNLNWRSISIGLNFCVGVLNDGTLWAWGSNSAGIFGKDYKLTDFFLSPVCLSKETTWDTVACGKKHVLALKFNQNGKKELWGWGNNSNGQLGLGSKTPYVQDPVNLLSKNPSLPKFWKNIAAGYDHSLILDENGILYSSGNNTSNQLGLFTEPIGTNFFTKVITDLKFSNIAAGDSFSLAIDNKGILFSWGNNTLGQLGIGTTVKTRKICKVDTKETNVLNISCGSNFSIFSTINGLFGFGDNTKNQLGISTKKNILTPQQIKINSSDLSKNETGDNIIWENLSCGSSHFAAIRKNFSKNISHLFLSGSNEFGQIGDDPLVVNKSVKGITVFKNKLSDTWQDVVCGFNTVIASTYPIPVSIAEASPSLINLKEGEVANLYVKAIGSEPLEYTWLVDNGYGYEQIEPPVKTSSITISNEGNYQCKVSNFSGTVYSEIFKINRYSVPKIIFFSPATQNLKLNPVLTEGKNTLLELIVSVTGVADSVTKTTNNPSTDFYFDWQLNGKSIYENPIHKRGRSMMSVEESICKATDSLKIGKDFTPGTYSCKIYNKYGFVKTQDWFLTSISQTKIISDFPEQIIISPLDSIPILIAETTGEDEVFYQWYCNEEPLENQTFKHLKLEKDGIYFLKIYNNNYELKTNKVSFSIKDPLNFLFQPPPEIHLSEIQSKEGISLNVKTSGFIIKNNNRTEEPIFQWYKNDTALSNENSSQLFLQGENIEGTYYCSVLNAGIKTNKSSITVDRLPVILNQTESLDFLLNKKNFNKIQIDFKGDLPIDVTWSKNLDNNSKKILKKFTISKENFTSETYSDFLYIETEGEYTCILENKAGKITSNPINVKNYQSACIENCLINKQLNLSKIFINKQRGPLLASLEVSSKGSGPLKHKWQIKKNKVWADLEEESNILNVGEPGQYRCTVSNELKPKGNKWPVQEFFVEEALPPQIIVQPKNKFTIKKGTSVNLICEVEDPDPESLNFQWFLNNEPIPYGTTNYISVSSLGNYVCKIENLYGETQTNTISLLYEEPNAYDNSKTGSLLIQKNKKFKKDGKDFLENIIKKHQLYSFNVDKCFAGYNNSFFINSNGVLYACGSNKEFELGLNITVLDVINLTNDSTKFNSFKKLNFNLIKNKNFKTSSSNINNNSLQDSFKYITSWVPVLSNVKKVAAGDSFSLALTLDNLIFSTGNNEYKQTGNSFDYNYENENLYLTNFSTWIKLKNFNSNPKDISTGLKHSLILLENGDLYGSGLNSNGQLATSLSESSENGSINDWIKIASNVKNMCAGYYNSYYTDYSNNLYACGNNSYNQVKSTLDSNVFEWNLIASNVDKIYAGKSTIFYIDIYGNSYSKGLNHLGQLGLNSEAEVVDDFEYLADNIIEFSCGENFTLAQKSDNSVWSTGDNTYGQLGTGNNNILFEFSKTFSNCKNVSAGNRHSLVNSIQNCIYSCGFNQYGQTGLEDDLVLNKKVDFFQNKSSLEFFNNINSWSSSLELEFINDLKNNELINFEIFKDSFLLITKNGFLMEKFSLSETNLAISASHNTFIETIYQNSLNEALPGYWYDGNNFVYLTKITNLTQVKDNSFYFSLKFYKFDIERGELIILLDDLIFFEFDHISNWSSYDYFINTPILNYSESSNIYNVSFSIKNNNKEMGLVSINIKPSIFSDKTYLIVDKIYCYLPWFLNLTKNSKNREKPSAELYYDSSPVLYEPLTIFSETTSEYNETTYQWFKDGELLENETNSYYFISNLMLSDLGHYELRISNPAGTTYENIWIQLT